MGWIYLAESEESLKLWTPGSDRLPIVKRTFFLRKCFFQECTEGSCQSHQSGQMSLPLEDQCFQRSMLSREGSLARTYLLRDFAKVWAASAADFFGKLSGLQKKQKRQLFFSKTSGQALENMYLPSEMRLKELDTKLGTVCLKQETLAPPIKELDGFVLLPTPTASRAGYQRGGAKGRKGPKIYSLESLWKMGKLPTPCARDWKDTALKSGIERKSPSLPTYWKATHGTTMPASFCEWIMGYQVGATALNLSVTRSFHSKQEKPL